VAGVCSGCAPEPPAGRAPTLDPLTDQVAQVGQELRLGLRASDADHDNLSYSFSSSIADFATRAHLRPYGDGASAELTWTPLASDVGAWAVDITVSDGVNQATETVTLSVVADGGAGAPIFRKPLGSGTTLDLAASGCLDLDVLVEDADSAHVTLRAPAPGIAGATLESTGPFSARWHWCPTGAQIAAQDRYPLTLAAADGENAETLLHYLIVLRKPPAPVGGTCTDDAFEPDDAPGAATQVDLDSGRFVAAGGAVCAGNEDWYEVVLYAGETLHATLAFDQVGAREDLDLQLLRGALNLHPCVETDVSGCGVARGSSTDSNETLVEPIATTASYFVVVRGWDGSHNRYHLCLGLSATDCPALP